MERHQRRQMASRSLRSIPRRQMATRRPASPTDARTKSSKLISGSGLRSVARKATRVIPKAETGHYTIASSRDTVLPISGGLKARKEPELLYDDPSSPHRGPLSRTWPQRFREETGYNTNQRSQEGRNSILNMQPGARSMEAMDNGLMPQSGWSQPPAPPYEAQSGAFMKRQRQQAMSTYQQGSIGSQNSMANLEQRQAQQPRAMGNGRTWHDPFIYPPPNINKSVVGNGLSVISQHTASRQRPETPPLTGFDSSPDPPSRTSKVSGPPASLPGHGITTTARRQAPFVNIPPHLLQQQQMNQQPGDPRHDAAPTHLQAQQYQQMLMQQRQTVAMRHALPSRFVENGLLPPAESFIPEWEMRPSPSTSQTPVDPNGPSFARDDAAKRKRKTSDQDDMPVQPNDGRCVSPRTFKNTRTLCCVYRFPEGRVQSTISEDHTTNLSKRRKLNFMALGHSKSYGATTKQHLRRNAEPNGRTRALIKV